MDRAYSSDSTKARVVDQRNRWASRGARFAGKVAALDRALEREASEPGHLKQFAGPWAVDLVIAAFSDDFTCRNKPIVHRGEIMPAAVAVHRIRRASFRNARQRAPQARRALPVTVRTIPRNRSRRAHANRPQGTSAGPPDSDEPAPALGGPNTVEIIGKFTTASRREGGKNG